MKCTDSKSKEQRKYAILLSIIEKIGISFLLVPLLKLIQNEYTKVTEMTAVDFKSFHRKESLQQKVPLIRPLNI